jgi:peptidoglycan/xylan/chitin deacetylase (PgdA/CDA1 family)
MSGILWLTILIAAPWPFFYLVWRLQFKKHRQTTFPVLTYHRVSDSLDLSITRQRIGQFQRGIRFLCEQGYKAVKLDEMLNPGEAESEKKVALTFDDAYQDFYLNAFPVLQKFGLTACIFVITGYVGEYANWDYSWGRKKKRHLTWEQMRELSVAGFDFGSHTVNHPDLTKIPKRFVEYELRKSKEILEGNLGQRVDFLSYPFGRYNRYVQEEAERSGYKGAFTLCSNTEGDGLETFSQSRWGVYLLDSPLTLRIRLNRSKLLWIEDLKRRIINAFPVWTVMVKGSPDYDGLEVKSHA